MQKPQVNINLNIDITHDSTRSNPLIQSQISDAVLRAKTILEELEDGCSAVPDQKPAKHRNEVPTSRHHQYVAANTRIMDAIEFINKEMRLLKGHSENGTLKVFEELKSILLGI